MSPTDESVNSASPTLSQCEKPSHQWARARSSSSSERISMLSGFMSFARISPKLRGESQLISLPKLLNWNACPWNSCAKSLSCQPCYQFLCNLFPRFVVRPLLGSKALSAAKHFRLAPKKFFVLLFIISAQESLNWDMRTSKALAPFQTTTNATWLQNFWKPGSGHSKNLQSKKFMTSLKLAQKTWSDPPK